MKLKLEQQDYGTLLAVTESIEPEQVAVIKAGLTQIFRSVSRPVLINLCALPSLRSERLASELLALKAWAACLNQEVFVASPIPELGDVPTLEPGLGLLANPASREEAQRSACSLYADKLERQKQALVKKLSVLEPGAASLRKLRKSNSDLRKRIGFAELQLRSMAPVHCANYEENASRLRTVERTLTSVLEKQGLLEASPS